jgi:uncharacterized protein YjeT (DUF2065 family)
VIDFLTALGLMFMLEGAMYALFPDHMKKMLHVFLALPPQQSRIFGLVFAVFGFLVVAVIRGF